MGVIFIELDTRSDQKYLLQKIPNVFINTGHGKTDLILDEVEFKFQSASNFDLSLEKPLLVHGMGIIFRGHSKHRKLNMSHLLDPLPPCHQKD